MSVEFWVQGHVLARRAARQDRRRVHGGVDGDLVPPHPLELLVRVGFGVFDAPALQEVDKHSVLLCCLRFGRRGRRLG